MATVFGLLLFSLYLATGTHDVVQVTDSHSSMVAAWGLGTTGGVTLPDTWQDLPWRAITVDGDVVSNRFPGATLWGAAFYAILPTATDVARAHDVPAFPAAVAAATAAALAMALLYVLLERLLDDRRVALGAATVFALGTATWSISSDALWTHGPAQLALVAGMLALTRDRWALAGAAFGAAMVCRPQLGVVAAVVGLWLTASRRSVRSALVIALTSLPGLVFLMVWTHELFGTWQPIAGYSRQALDAGAGIIADPIRRTTTTGFRPFASLFPVLFHPLRGVLVYSSWLWVCLPGLRRGWRAAPDWVRASAVAGLVAILVQLSVNVWHGGDDQFGYRLPLEWLTLSMPLLVLSWREVAARSRAGRVATALLATTSVVLFGFGSTIADPRNPERAAYLEMVEDLGPNGEGYNPRTAVGVDASRR